ncbi:hypothetical protein [Limobrevibacterium gyesilva]|uniref:Uncharacterized protein n=1 Tax=Limobrevibacterium gyesilva TaxID=2991712 RepID=A0AA42CGC3_9PROT|nr:hypothetical protein [Limobrevibacterium gyesilva]MCW3473867.1 hypothetical protein [Limobrevibacterium gyesilva]
MKLLLLALVLAGAGGIAYPRMHEQTDSACAALDKRLQSLIQLRFQALKLASNPRLAGAAASAQASLPAGATIVAWLHEKLPFLPPEVGCAAAYWMTVVQPDLTQLIPASLPIKPPGG